MHFLPLPKLEENDVRRFYERFRIRSFMECWNWETNEQRPTFKIKQVKYVAARVAWLIFHDEDPGEKLVCHSCDNPTCMNPNHLYLGTSSDNMRECFDKGRGRISNQKLNGKELAKQIRQDYKLQTSKIGKRSEIIENLRQKYGYASKVSIHKILKGEQWSA